MKNETVFLGVEHQSALSLFHTRPAVQPAKLMDSTRDAMKATPQAVGWVSDSIGAIVSLRAEVIDLTGVVAAVTVSVVPLAEDLTTALAIITPQRTVLEVASCQDITPIEEVIDRNLEGMIVRGTPLHTLTPRPPTMAGLAPPRWGQTRSNTKTCLLKFIRINRCNSPCRTCSHKAPPRVSPKATAISLAHLPLRTSKANGRHRLLLLCLESQAGDEVATTA